MRGLPCPPEHWDEFSALLDEGLAQPVETRERWLDTLPPQKAHLRTWLADVLRADARARTDDYLARLKLTEAPETEGTFTAGQPIGPYRLEAPLGRGGMGEVWSALRVDGALDRTVALKLPRADLMTLALRSRLARERDILASLTHPHIAQLYDAGVTAQHQPYLALELVEGQPIDAHCREHRLGVDARITLFLQVLDAVGFAHRHLVVHRDLKPSNIFVTKDAQVKLLDFGIAKLLDEPGGGADETELTRLSGRAMTPEYAAPEQLIGEAVTVATDVFALGVVLFQLLTGQRPFGRQRTEEAPLLSTRIEPDHAEQCGLASPRALKRELEGDLDAIVACCLSHAPDERYASVEQFADDLRRHLQDEPIRARHIGRLERSWKFVRRHRLPAAMAAGLAVALLAGAGGVLWQAERARTAAVDALAARNQAQASRDRAEGLIAFMLGDLREKLRTVGRLDILDSIVDQSTSYFASRDPATLTDQELDSRAALLRLTAEVKSHRGTPSEMLEPLRAALELDRRLVERGPSAERLARLALDEMQIADAHGELGDFESNLKVARQAVVDMERAYAVSRAENAKDSWKTEVLAASMHGGVAHALRRLGRQDEAIAEYEAAFRISEPIAAAHPDDVELQMDTFELLAGISTSLSQGYRFEEVPAVNEKQTRLLRALHERVPNNMLVTGYFASSLNRLIQSRSVLGEVSGSQALLAELQRTADALVTRDPSNEDWQDLQIEINGRRREICDIAADLACGYTASRASWSVIRQRMASTPKERPPLRDRIFIRSGVEAAAAALNVDRVEEARTTLDEVAPLVDAIIRNPGQEAADETRTLLEFHFTRLQLDRRLGRPTPRLYLDDLRSRMATSAPFDTQRWKSDLLADRAATPPPLPAWVPVCGVVYRRLLRFAHRNDLQVPGAVSCPAVAAT